MSKRKETPWYRKQRAKFKKDGQTTDAHCWICGDPIDYNAPRADRDSHTLDHYYPVELYPHLHDDPANWRHAHWKCNSSRGTAQVTKTNTTIPCWWR